MIGGKTKNGFSFKVDERILNDWDVVEKLDKLRTDGENATMSEISELIQAILGKKGFESLKGFAREKNGGIADVDTIKNEFVEVLSHIKAKNSSSSPSV